MTKKEFNELADLLNVKTADEKNVFEVELFRNNSKKGGHSVDFDDMIIIEKNEMNKYGNMFDDLKDIDNEDDTDLLNLMDMAVNNN